jgi:5'(3')-deoxyribonucleotidase
MIDICYFDMDGVLCDYEGARKLQIDRNPRISFPQSQLKFFENLEPIDGSIDSYFRLKEKYNVMILTKPSYYNPLCYMEKRLWVEKYLGFEECRKLILSRDKTLLRGSYLIDDLEQTGVFKPEWDHIHFKSEKFPNWDSILNYLL